MAGRILNRRELRQQADDAELQEDADGGVAVKPAKKAAKAATKRKPRAKKAPPRVRARWGIFDGGMKQVAIFDYSQHAAAQQKLADLLATKKGVFFLQIVKDAMPEPALTV